MPSMVCSGIRAKPSTWSYCSLRVSEQRRSVAPSTKEYWLPSRSYTARLMAFGMLWRTTAGGADVLAVSEASCDSVLVLADEVPPEARPRSVSSETRLGDFGVRRPLAAMP